jgi:two-component system, chemotaxis family, sensor kinase CheA
MSETSAGTGAEGGLDLTQFYQVFFEEAGENLDRMEQQLLEIDIESADDEELNSIFRCAHSVKGGAATFGFKDVAELTHQMETLLDKLRRHELEPSAAMVDVLLKSGDALKAQLARHQAGGVGDLVDTSELLRSIRAMSMGGAAPHVPSAPAAAPSQVPAAPGVSAAPAQPAAVPAAVPVASAALADGKRALELVVGPLESPALANNLVELFSEIVDLGTIEPLDGGQAADGMRRFKVITSSSDNDLLDLFTFHVAREHVKLLPLGQGYGFHEGAPGAPKEPQDDPTFGLFEGAPGAPGAASAAPAAVATTTADDSAPALASAQATGAPKASPAKAAAASAEAATLRVSVEKVDQLINLVGELVITQAMLAQNSAKMDPSLYAQLAKGLADLDRNTRDLQESVMSIRMIPMSMVFSRFPRMLRDLAAKLGKKVDFVTKGEATELDKGLVEKITDPLTHLVRNSCDHGIELPAERIAKGKSETGTLTLAASHQGGSIVIEVRDDGKGLSRAKLLAKARERGLDVSDAMSDTEVWSLIFAPGFSTAEVVTDVSGRGVGMDVVKKNITSLGGTVEIESAEGYGMSVKVRLPLTLAIMDGMSVGVGDEVYILPLASVVETFQVEQGHVRTVGGNGRVVEVRNEYMPVLELERIFDVPRRDPDSAAGIMVVVEADSGRVALLVDSLLGQQQVVVKNLESNYRKVNDVSGATIMGDGRVALILDVGSLARRARH